MWPRTAVPTRIVTSEIHLVEWRKRVRGARSFISKIWLRIPHISAHIPLVELRGKTIHSCKGCWKQQAAKCPAKHPSIVERGGGWSYGGTTREVEQAQWPLWAWYFSFTKHIPWIVTLLFYQINVKYDPFSVNHTLCFPGKSDAPIWRQLSQPLKRRWKISSTWTLRGLQSGLSGSENSI